MARLTAEEERLIESIVDLRIQKIQARIENEHNRVMQQVNDALDEFVDAASKVKEMERIETRVVNMIEALEPRIEQLEAEFGW